MQNKWQNRVIALTGSIACGKSTAAKIFKSHGAMVVNADDLAREAVKPGTPAIQTISEKFGAQYIHLDGSLNREKLAKTVFGDADKRALLNSIVHPRVAELAENHFSNLDTSAIQIYEVPLFFETNMEAQGYKSIIVVYTDKDNTLRRLLRRNNLSEQEALDRINSQLPIEAKLAQADYVLDNNQDEQHLEEQISKLIPQLSK